MLVPFFFLWPPTRYRRALGENKIKKGQTKTRETTLLTVFLNKIQGKLKSLDLTPLQIPNDAHPVNTK